MVKLTRKNKEWVDEHEQANIRTFSSSMVKVSRIDKENGGRSIFVEKFTNTVLYNFFRVKKYSASGIILCGSCLGCNCPKWE